MSFTLLDALFASIVLSGVVLCWLGVDAYRSWDEPGLRTFVLTVLTLGVGALLSGIVGFVAVAGGGTLRWQLPLLAAFFLASVSWALFAFQYTGQWAKPSLAAVTGLTVPALLGLGAYTTGYVTQVWGMDPATLGVPAALLNIGYGVGYLWVTALIVVGAFLLLRTTHVYGHLSILQGGALSLAAVAPALTGVVGPSLGGLAGTPGLVGAFAGGIGLSALCFVAAVRYYETFEATPAVGSIGRAALSREIDDLVVVTDHRQRTIETNEAVGKTLGVETATMLGKPVESLLGLDIETLQRREAVELHTTDGHRTFDAKVSELTDQHDRWLGYLVSLRDVTDRQIRQQRLEVLNRVLRHNLRNKLTVVKGSTKAIEEQAEGTAAHTERILSATDDLIGISERAKSIEKYVDDGERMRTEVNVFETVTEVLDNVRGLHPDVTITADVPESLVLDINEGLLYHVLDNAVQNGVKHNDSEEPRVEVTVTTHEDTDHSVRVAITDNGPGIPEHELDVIRSGRETDLKHGSGLGLWVLSWGTRQLRGTLSFERHDDGSTVCIELPHTPLPTDQHTRKSAPAATDGDGRPRRG